MEKLIENLIDEASYQIVTDRFDSIRRERFPKPQSQDDGAWTALYCAVHRRWRAEYDESHAQDRWRIAFVVTLDARSTAGPQEQTVQVGLLRDIFGNPFRPVTFDPVWQTSDVLALARGIYEERAFDRLPILADALQDAGCECDDLLGHLRDPAAAHVRGCWALDLVLGKE